jgi:hypothetical protein
MDKNYVWGLPKESENWAIDEEKLVEKFNEIIDYARLMLGKEGYCVILHEWRDTEHGLIERIYVGRPDTVKRFIDDLVLKVAEERKSMRHTYEWFEDENVF